KRLLRLVARHADAWNVPFLAPEIFAQRNATLDGWCEREGRDPRAITRTVNLGLAVGRDDAQVRRPEESLRLMFGPMPDFVRPGRRDRSGACHGAAGARAPHHQAQGA